MNVNQIVAQFLGGGAGSAPAVNNNSTGLAGLTNSIPGGLAGGLAAGGLLGVLVGNKKLRKRVGKFAGSAAAMGGTAALGVLAYKAYQNWQGRATHGAQAANQAHVQSVDVPDRFNPAQTLSRDGEDFQLVLIKAMIAAANADGHIDGDEQAAVFDAVNKLQLDTEARALVFDTLQDPPSFETLASQASGIEQASEIYLASRLAIDPDHPAEQRYLERLADRLALPPDLVAHLERQVEESQKNAA